jgi:hypothetical protein
MYSHGHRKQIGRMSELGGVPRRRLLQGAAALGLTAIPRPTAAFAEPDDDDVERLGPFGPWSTPVNLGPVVNSQYNDITPAISKNGLSLYFDSTRPGGVNGANPGNVEELWVSKRTSLDAPWETPINLDAFNPVPVINSIGASASGHNTAFPNFSPDGHFMYFDSPRPRPDACGAADLYVSWRINKRNDFGWQEPINLGCTINSPDFDNGSNYFEDEETGIISMYFSSTRPGGPSGSQPGSYHIYVSTLGDDGSFGPAVLVPELNSTYDDGRTAIRRDGLEMFLTSTRPGGVGGKDIWVSTRETTSDPWSTPVNLGARVNSPYDDGQQALSWDGTTMYFFSARPGGFGGLDLYVTTRRELRRHEAEKRI